MIQTRPDALAFVADLASFGDRTALVGPDGQRVSYSVLADLIEEAATHLDGPRALVVVSMSNTIDAVVRYLGALRAGHPVLVTDGRSSGDLVRRYRPGYAWDGPGALRRYDSPAPVHPALALLLSTSGSTGSPRLVRLSRENVAANAAAIADYLPISADDVAALTLPLSYCYGLSVLHTHLLRGAAVWLPSRSVADPVFWDEFRSVGATSLAGVPYTFELLDRVGFAALQLPTLRYVTQAGGRLSPDAVRRFASMGDWELYVMYGQTEATARMAYLPAHLAAAHPDAVGVPVKAGSFSIESGEIVYRGPNVMLGYATHPSDLALGRTVTELRTGDLGEIGPDGLLRITGRIRRIAKPFGLRVDLDRVESALAGAGVEAFCTGDDARLVVAVRAGADAAAVTRTVQDCCGVPRGAIDVLVLPELPRTASGKPDYPAVLAAGQPRTDAASVADIFRLLLGRSEVAPHDSFVSLGGDSLSHVEASVRLEELLGDLPVDWATTPVALLDATRCPPTRRARVETNVLLRAVAIVSIVAAHLGLYAKGGGHTLLLLAGFSFARFPLAAALLADRVRPVWRSLLRMAVPAVAIICAYVAFFPEYHWTNVLLVNSYLGPPTAASPTWHFWFVEALVQDVLLLTLLLAIPVVRRLAGRHPFQVSLAFLTAGLLVRWDVLNVSGLASEIYRPHTTFFVFALGWAAFAARTHRQRAFLTVLAPVAFAGFFPGDRPREAAVTLAFAVLLWIPSVRTPRWVARLIGAVASASLYIFLTHWAVLAWLKDDLPAAMVLPLCILVGIGTTALTGTSRRRRDLSMAGRS